MIYCIICKLSAGELVGGYMATRRGEGTGGLERNAATFVCG